MTFNPQRAEALRTAIIGTSQTIRHYPDSDAKNLLTEHLALLQEAELICLTDTFVGEDDPNFNNVSLILHGNGAKGPTAFTNHPDNIDRPAEPEWVEWQGQYQNGPIRDIGVRFDVRLRNSSILWSVEPDDCRWRHNGENGDIVAYKVAK